MQCNTPTVPHGCHSIFLAYPSLFSLHITLQLFNWDELFLLFIFLSIYHTALITTI